MTSGLVLVDIQNDYFSGGAMALVDMEQAAENAVKVLDKFRAANLPVFHIRHTSVQPGATFFLPGTKGAEIHAAVAPRAEGTTIEKHFPNSFRDTDLLECLKKEGVGEIVICGAMSHMCIDATTRAAFDLGFRCVVIGDACATRDLEFQGGVVAAGDVHAAFMAALAGVYARVLMADELVVP